MTILAFVVLEASVASAAVDPCCDEERQPSLLNLEQTATGLRAVLYGKPGNPDTWPYQRPALKYSRDLGWQPDEPSGLDKPLSRKSATNADTTFDDVAAAAISLSAQEAEALRPELKGAIELEQRIGASTDYDGAVWFGISFYAGEGSDSVGGIGRYDRKTLEVVVRRPAAIRDSSINDIAHDGKWLWIGTSTHGEYQTWPTHGLARYDWSADRVETYEGSDDGPCGFEVRGLVLDPEYLWVATELGLSRRNRDAQTWEHFVPDADAKERMRPTTCEAIYNGLLQTLPKSTANGEHRCCFSQLFESLQRFRPRFLAAHIKDIPPAQWDCDVLTVLAQRSPDYASLKANVLDLYPADGRDLSCALISFGETKKSREPEWRDFLLSRLESGSDVIELLAEFPGDAKVGHAFARRLETTINLNPWWEAELLPSFLGDRSVPILIEALDRFGPERERVVASVIVGLMRATHTAIGPDGKLTQIPAAVDPDRCAIFGCPSRDDVVARVADQWRAWWVTHKQEYASPEP